MVSGMKAKANFALLVSGWAALTLMSPTPAFAQHMNEKDAPCQGVGSGADMAQCMYSAFQKADRELNNTYRQIFPKIEPAQQAELRTAQRLWVQFRDADCKAEYDLFGGGSGGPTAKSTCLEAVTRQRIEDLKAAYGNY
jgi:uncharacterized protein YecT (DUF1311 family)